MKTCHLCSQEKDLSEFYKTPTSFMKACKACHNKRAVKWQAKNVEKKRAAVRACHSKKYKEEPERYKAYVGASYKKRREFIEGLKSLPCMDCKKSFPPECMDFDHVKGEKKFAISTKWSCNYAELVEEIKKCDVVCSNCHRMRTRQRLVPSQSK